MSTPNVKTDTKNLDPWDKLGIGTAPISAVPHLLDIAFSMKQKMTLCLVGETGIGKTPIVKQWAEKQGGFVRIFNLAHVSTESLSMSMFNEEGTSYGFLAPDILHELNAEAEKRGLAVLFLDEVNRAEKEIIKMAFTIPDDRRIHSFDLHPNVLVVAAMNPSGGTYLVNHMENDHAIRKRLNFVFVQPDLAGWLQHATETGYHPLVVSFVRARSTLFYDTAARDAGKAFTCPSNWEKVSNVLLAADQRKVSLTSTAVRLLVEGQIGKMAATQFLDFVADQNTVLQPSDIFENYEKNTRHRVAKLLNKKLQGNKLVADTLLTGSARIDVLSELLRAISISLASEMPPPELVGPGLAVFLMDIPTELYTAFWSEHMRMNVNLNDDKMQKYIRHLNMVLKENKDYSEHVNAFATRSAAISDALAASKKAS